MGNLFPPHNVRTISIVVLCFFLFLALVYIYQHHIDDSVQGPLKTYPDQTTYWKYKDEKTNYNIAIISDMDKGSKISGEDTWISKYSRGILSRKSDGTFTVKWTAEGKLESKFNEAGRGMELSELSFFNHKLYTVDDRTGLVYDITSDIAVPNYILMDGDGQKNKGFKCEWSTVKDGKLYIGSMGKEWVQDGVVKSIDPEYVKVISKDGRIEHQNWKSFYDKLRVASGTTSPGYLLHEAVNWNPVERKWYFLPRRVSFEEYDEVLDEERCGNIAIVADENFSKVEVIKDVGPLNKLRGFSSFKFLPYSESEIVALKTQEKDETVTYITVIDITSGRVLLPETKIGNVKYEGVEFL